MHNSPSDEAGRGYNVQPQEPQQDAQDNSAYQPSAVVTLAICDVDVPCVLLAGDLYPTVPLQTIFDAFAAAVSEVLRDMETGISEARSAALASAHLQRSLFGEAVALKIVVRDSWDR